MVSVKIRLLRAGAKHRPFYRVVVTDSRSPRDGRFIEMLGYYDPVPENPLVKIDAEKVNEWIGRGAIPTDTVKSLLKRAGQMPTVEAVAETARAARLEAIESANRLAPAPKPKSEDPKSVEEKKKPAPKGGAAAGAVERKPTPDGTPETKKSETK